MIGARVKCDHCGFIGNMEFTANCKSTVQTPPGWAMVYPTIKIKGERQLGEDQRKELKKKLSDKTRSFHVCPECVFGAWEFKLDRLLTGGSNATA